jgi:hypothetical protein
MTSVAQLIGSHTCIFDIVAHDKVYNVHKEFNHKLGFTISKKYLK